MIDIVVVSLLWIGFSLTVVLVCVVANRRARAARERLAAEANSPPVVPAKPVAPSCVVCGGPGCGYRGLCQTCCYSEQGVAEVQRQMATECVALPPQPNWKACGGCDGSGRRRIICFHESAEHCSRDCRRGWKECWGCDGSGKVVA